MITFTANIYVGLKEGYEGPTHTFDGARFIIREYVSSIGLCVTITPTEFWYVNGNEPGIIVGLINYPRFPTTPQRIKDMAIELGYQLKDAFKQQRISIVCTDETIMLE